MALMKQRAPQPYSISLPEDIKSRQNNFRVTAGERWAKLSKQTPTYYPAKQSMTRSFDVCPNAISK
jgi:hypothetical protein